MYRVKFSRWVNYRVFGGKPYQMVSSRVYEERRYFWMLTIDWWMYVVKRDIYHCATVAQWERKQHDSSSNKSATRKKKA